MFFIHKYSDDLLVRFAKEPQVKHTISQWKPQGKVPFYVRTIRGRIAKVTAVYQKEVDTAKDNDYTRLEMKWFFTCVFLDDNQKLELNPNVNMACVRIKWIHLFAYRIYKYFKNQTTVK